MNHFLFNLDKKFQTSIKEENSDSYVDKHLTTSSISTNNIDQPLLIVLDDDDINEDDENEQFNLTTTKINPTENLSNNEETNTNPSNQNWPSGINLFLKYENFVLVLFFLKKSHILTTIVFS